MGAPPENSLICPTRRLVLCQTASVAGLALLAPQSTFGREFADDNAIAAGQALRSPDLHTAGAVSVQHNLVTGTLINFGYRTPAGNQPSEFQNGVYLWPVSANQIPWTSPSVAQDGILLNQPRGDQNLTNIALGTDAYILGYAVGPDTPKTADNTGTYWTEFGNVVASAYIAGTSKSLTLQETARCLVKPLFVGTNSLSYQFEFLTGFFAARSGAWAGVWEGSAVSYAVPPKWHAKIQIESSQGVSGLNGLNFERGQKYTIGLYPTGYSDDPASLDLKRLAAFSVFSG
ncbi:hypothetical protein [Falsiphaeobacter marinintestinus]|uniref:hypothetical protein n=1 Tax=Falsiphaeobacter marinintestinus TaxID=1492905 RepID=UPI0011B78AC9|nr:hypothetical protein [Phaeobacter marinintestinus]